MGDEFGTDQATPDFQPWLEVSVSSFDCLFFVKIVFDKLACLCLSSWFVTVLSVRLRDVW